MPQKIPDGLGLASAEHRLDLDGGLRSVVAEHSLFLHAVQFCDRFLDGLSAPPREFFVYLVSGQHMIVIHYLVNRFTDTQYLTGSNIIDVAISRLRFILYE
jgi:hypothetical protein